MARRGTPPCATANRDCRGSGPADTSAGPCSRRSTPRWCRHPASSRGFPLARPALGWRGSRTRRSATRRPFPEACCARSRGNCPSVPRPGAIRSPARRARRGSSPSTPGTNRGGRESPADRGSSREIAGCASRRRSPWCRSDGLPRQGWATRPPCLSSPAAGGRRSFAGCPCSKCDPRRTQPPSRVAKVRSGGCSDGWRPTCLGTSGHPCAFGPERAG